jgi:uncharacterized membrane protein
MRIPGFATPIVTAFTNRSARTTEIGWALALLSTFCFSFAPPVARFAILGGFDSTALLAVRMVIATTLFGLTLAVTDRQKLHLPRRGLLAATLVGAVNAVGMILFFFGLTFLEASLSSMILALGPAMVLSLLALRGEALTRRHLVRLGLALVGVYLLIGPTGTMNWLGAGITLLATFFFALQMALTQWTLIGYPARSVMFYVTGTMTLFVVGWWLVRGCVERAQRRRLDGGAAAGGGEHLPGPLRLLQCTHPHWQQPDGVAGTAGNAAQRDLVDPLSARGAGPLADRRGRADSGKRTAGRAPLWRHPTALAATVRMGRTPGDYSRQTDRRPSTGIQFDPVPDRRGARVVADSRAGRFLHPAPAIGRDECP